YPCGRARPTGASGPAVSGVHAAHKTAHPLCPVSGILRNQSVNNAELSEESLITRRKKMRAVVFSDYGDAEVLELCTHFDLDHCGHHEDFPNAELVVQRKHYDVAHGGHQRFAV